jgi:PadR family transcriptional regulator PadR
VKNPKEDVLRGTLDLLVLRTLALEPMHGWGISERIQQASSDVLRVNQGALYPALHRLEKQGLIASDWGRSQNNRRAKFYRLTTPGRRHLTLEQEGWVRFTGAVNAILGEGSPG